jgi:hypothetical protein
MSARTCVRCISHFRVDKASRTHLHEKLTTQVAMRLDKVVAAFQILPVKMLSRNAVLYQERFGYYPSSRPHKALRKQAFYRTIKAVVCLYAFMLVWKGRFNGKELREIPHHPASDETAREASIYHSNVTE